MKAEIFLLCPFTDDEPPKIRLCISGIDNGSAAHLDMECTGDRKYAQLLVEKIASELKIKNSPDQWLE